MRGKDHLFHLIHSLSKSEKRYFTLDARKGGKTNSRYLELFQFINKQTAYDEKPLKKKFGARLGDDKARLYEAILGSMREYQSKKSYKIRIKELLTDAKILFERKLYDQSENRLNEAKDLALELQDHLAVLEINVKQRQLMREHLGKDYAEEVEALIKEKEFHIGLLEKEFWLNDNYDRLSVKYLQFPYKLDDDEIEELNGEYADVLNMKADELDSFMAEWRYHKFMALYCRLTGETDKVLHHFQQTVESWKHYPKIISEDFIIYIGEVSNLLSAISKSAKRFSELPTQLAFLKKQKASNIQGEKLLFRQSSVFELIYLLNSKAEAIDDFIQNLEKGLNKYALKPKSEFSILSNVALLLFLNDRFHECLIWLEKIMSLQKKHKNVRKDIQDYNRILYLMAIQKINSFEQIENALRATNRYFNKNKDSKLFAFYNLFSSKIQKLQSSSSKKEEKKHLLTFKKEMEGKIHADLDEICLLWIESLIQNKKISELRKLF